MKIITKSIFHAKFLRHPIRVTPISSTRKLLVFIFLTYLFSPIAIADATPPRYFDTIEVTIAPNVDPLATNTLMLTLEGPNPRNDGVMVKSVGVSGVIIGDPDKSYIDSFPTVFSFPIKLTAVDVGVFQIIINPTRAGRILPPLKKTFKLYFQNGSLMLEEIEAKTSERGSSQLTQVVDSGEANDATAFSTIFLKADPTATFLDKYGEEPFQDQSFIYFQ